MPFLKRGQDEGGQAIYECPEKRIVPARILVDEYGNPARISAGIPDPNKVVNIAIKTVSNKKAFPTGAKKVFFYANSGFYYKFGNKKVVATKKSSQLPPGIGEFNIGNYTHIAVLRIANDGNLNMTKMD